jgi:hypothetical protein
VASIGLLQAADCDLWKVMDGPERRGLLAGLKRFFGARVDASSTAGQRGAVLSDPQATRLFTSYCRQSFAGAFKLYKIYGRAAAFTAP